MQYFWWGCRRNLKLITLGSERVTQSDVRLKSTAEHWAIVFILLLFFLLFALTRLQFSSNQVQHMPKWEVLFQSVLQIGRMLHSLQMRRNQCIIPRQRRRNRDRSPRQKRLDPWLNQVETQSWTRVTEHWSINQEPRRANINSSNKITVKRSAVYSSIWFECNFSYQPNMQVWVEVSDSSLFYQPNIVPGPRDILVQPKPKMLVEFSFDGFLTAAVATIWSSGE